LENPPQIGAPRSLIRKTLTSKKGRGGQAPGEISSRPAEFIGQDNAKGGKRLGSKKRLGSENAIVHPIVVFSGGEGGGGKRRGKTLLPISRDTKHKSLGRVTSTWRNRSRSKRIKIGRTSKGKEDGEEREEERARGCRDEKDPTTTEQKKVV